MRRTAPFIAACFAMAFAAPTAHAGNGGASAPDAPLQKLGQSGGTKVEAQRTEAKPPTTAPHESTHAPRASRRPILSSFSLSATQLSPSGTPAIASFKINGGSRLRDVVLRLLPSGSRRAASTIHLGALTRGRTHSFRITGREHGRLAAGTYTVRISARDRRGRTLRRSAGISSVAALTVLGATSTASHRFPLLGTAWTYGTGDGRFGAKRNGHTHQGQDLPAPEGTPVVAPHAGVVETVRYQAGGAGYYVVLDSDGEDADYVFMHLRKGSTLVTVGQHVGTGQQLAQVGNTGGSDGAHLHFEIWTGGGWYAGGEPVDPLPFLQGWNAVR